MVICTGDPASYEYLESEVRPHLAKIIREERLCNFPARQHCYCNAPAGGRMVACDHCDQWFHISCLSGPVCGNQWLCRQCK